MPLPTAEELEEQARQVEREAATRAALIQREAAARAAQLRRDAADIRRLEKRLVIPAGAAREFDRELATLLPRPAAEQDLPSRPPDSSIVVAMTANNATAPLVRPRMGRPLETDHAFPRRLEALGSDVEAWAKEHDLNPKKVRSWYQKSQPRRIPRHWAETIEREMGTDESSKPYVPATLATWPSGIR